MGVVKLRLARFGRKNMPFYRIHAADSRAPRDGKFLEKIGWYNPLPVGAQPSDVVKRLFFIAGILPKPPVPPMPKKPHRQQIKESPSKEH